MVRSLLTLAAATAAIALHGGCTIPGVAVAQGRPPPTRPITDIAREERAVVINVHDTRLDLSTGMGRGKIGRAHV